MLTIPSHAGKEFYRSVAWHSNRQVEQHLERFRSSLEGWLYAALNWPEDDWEADWQRFLDHTHRSGIEISADSRAQLHALLRDRATGTGRFAGLNRPRRDPTNLPIQLAIAPGAPAKDTATGATLDLSSHPTWRTPRTRNEYDAPRTASRNTLDQRDCMLATKNDG
jgi:hypothetical protein